MILTDLKDGASTFSLMPEEKEITLRFIDYSQLYNDKTKKIIALPDVLKEEKLKAECEKEHMNLYTLKFKFKLDELTQELANTLNNGKHSLAPYLESAND